jgi:hypothetical protein
MSNFWSSYAQGSDVSSRRSRIVVRHQETNEYFNLISFADEYQDLLAIHSCGDTVLDYPFPASGSWELQANAPTSALQLTYPVGTTPTSYLPNATYTVVGTSKMIFIGSKFQIDAQDFSSTGAFGFLDSYSNTRYKFVGGLPTDNFTCRPIDLSDHFWATGYQNFSVRFADSDGITLHLTTFQVLDWSDAIQDFSEIPIFPLVFYEKGTKEYSGRIAGELPDCWRIGIPVSTLFIADLMYCNAEGTSVMLKVFKDGMRSDRGIAVRYE